MTLPKNGGSLGAQVKVNAQAASQTGNTSRELYLTLIHEFIHALFDGNDFEAGVDPASTNESEHAIDDFAADLLNQIENLAEQSNNNPYESEECNA